MFHSFLVLIATAELRLDAVNKLHLKITFARDFFIEKHGQ